MFCRTNKILLGTLFVFWIFDPLRGSANRDAEAHPMEEIKEKTELFSPQWVQEFSSDKLGCEQGRGLYNWRHDGFGSNINCLMNSWVYGLVVEGWSDVGLLVDKRQLAGLECFEESEGQASRGWNCLFSDMPHLCVFNTTAMWKQHLVHAGVSAEDQKEAVRISTPLTVILNANITSNLEGLAVDQRGAKAAVAKFLWSFITPWVRRDVRQVTSLRGTFGTSPFIGLHIRRGDKLIAGRHREYRHDVEAYLKEAVIFLEKGLNGTSADDIEGIWVASDDAKMIDEVRTLAGNYFPSVRSEDIVYAANGVAGSLQPSNMVTHTNHQSYGSLVYLMADLEQLAAADVFVGTCSSNIGRLVMLLRDNLGKDQDSGISLDKPWLPNRARSLEQD
eukprot:jgi/Undpi1/12118/HiC_scaffold_5.g01794.m1